MPEKNKYKVDAFEEGRVWITLNGEPVLKVVPTKTPEQELITAYKTVKSLNMHDELVEKLKYARRFLNEKEVDTNYIDELLKQAEHK